MSTHDTDELIRDDDPALRALLAQADPAGSDPHDHPADPALLDRVLDVVDFGALDEAPTPHPAFLRRHWQGTILVAASVLTLALAGGSVLPGLVGGGSDSMAAGASEMTSDDSSASNGSLDMTLTDGLTAMSDAAAAPAAGSETTAGGAKSADTEEANTLVRSASLLVGTEDVTSARDSFVALVLGEGGRVTSETVITDTTSAQAMDMAAASGMDMIYPWYPTGPGIWLTVEVPEADYDATVAAAQDLGAVVQLQQSSYDVGTQITDTEARIAALESSLTQLTALMDEATSVSDVIKLERAITSRQAELDSLRAQQRDLDNQTSMSQISLTLMTPDDAAQSIDPTPDQSWWQ